MSVWESSCRTVEDSEFSHSLGRSQPLVHRRCADRVQSNRLWQLGFEVLMSRASSRGYSLRMPPSFTSLEVRAISAFIAAVNSCGELPSVSMPVAVNFSLMSGRLMARTIS